MILDSSALLAIVLDEPDRDAILARIDAAEVVGIGAPTLVEAGIVLSARLGSDGSVPLTNLLEAGDIVVIEFGEAHWREAFAAWLRYGRGRHAAALNLGDCLAYATAKVAGRPLLAKGDDFRRTDLELA